jgi:transposase
MTIALVGLDLAKEIFHIHATDERGREVLRKKLYRDEVPGYFAKLPRTRVVMEACGGSNYWAREIEALGHRTELISPQYVKPFVQRNKTDAKDAEAICIAARQPAMRYVPKRSAEQQDIQNLHRIRQRLVKSRTALVNEIRGFLAEYGIIISKGRRTFAKVFNEVVFKHQGRLSRLAQETFQDLWQEYLAIEERLEVLERRLKALTKDDLVCVRLMTIPGVGYLTASAMLAAVGDIGVFKNGRELAAWLGLTPREHSTGGKQQLYGISKRGDTYLRTLLIHGARISLRYLSKRDDRQSEWAKDLLKRKGANRTAVALANKNARAVWALMTSQECYKTLPLAA